MPEDLVPEEEIEEWHPKGEIRILDPKSLKPSKSPEAP
jgi:hypothetical protein